MNKVGKFVVLLLLLFGCVHKRPGEQNTSLLSHFIEISDNESKGVHDVLDLYGGKLKYSIGKDYSTVTGMKNYFELELSESALMEQYKDSSEFTGSNIAYLFYRNLKKEASHYNYIKVKIDFSDGKTKEYSYSTQDLYLVNLKMPLLFQMIRMTANNSIDSIKNLLPDTTFTRFDVLNIFKNV